MADSTAHWAAPGPGAPPTRPHTLGAARPAAPDQSAAAQIAAGQITPAQIATYGPNSPYATALPPASPPGTALPGSLHSGAGRPRPGAARRSGTRPIPLRPLSVLEVIDAGAGALRSIPRRVHLIVAAFTAGLALLGFGLLFLVQHQVDVLVSHGSYSTSDFFGNVTVYEGIASPTTNFGRFLLDDLFATVFSGLAVTVAAGLYATSVQRYVDGQPADLAAAQAGYRGRAVALFWLALVTALPRLLMTGLAALLTLDSAAHQGGSAGAGFLWLALLGTPVCFLATAKTAVAVPALVLERITGRKALSRSSHLAVGGHWRSGWTSLFALLTTCAPIILLSIFLFATKIENSDDGSFTGLFSVLNLIVTAVVILASVPLRATTATMIYVDRRFRREGLDVRIAWARVAKEAL